MSDVILSKISKLERYIARICEEYNNDDSNLENYTKQDAIILNLQRACQISIDLAMHFISMKKLGLPNSTKEAFQILFNNNIIEKKLYDNLSAMVGFRDIAIHEYEKINLDILKTIIKEHLNYLVEFANIINNLDAR